MFGVIVILLYRNAYRRLGNEAKRVLDRRRRAYLGELLGRDVRRFWARMKQFGANFSSRGGSSRLASEEPDLSGDQLNEHFAGVGARVAEAARAAHEGASDAGPRPYRVCVSANPPPCLSFHIPSAS